MGLLQWFKKTGNSIKTVNTVDRAINEFPMIHKTKITTLLAIKKEWTAKDADVTSKRIIDGYDKKITPKNVNVLGPEYLDFYKTIFPERDGDEIIKKINEDKVEHFIEKKLNEQEVLDPQTIEEIINMSKALSVTTYDSKEKIRADFDYYITNWELDNGLFKGLSADFIMQRNELCIYKADKCELLEQRTVTKRINYSGPSYRIKIMKGLSYRLGSYNVSTEKETVEISKGRGLVNVTTKRLLFKSGDGVVTINNSAIVNLEPYNNAVVIIKATGKPLIFKTPDAIILYQYIRAVLRI